MDYLSRLDRETWFDQAPSHPIKNSRLVEARVNADLAWQDYYRVLEREIHADTAEFRQPDYTKIQMYLDLADQAENDYSKIYDELNEVKDGHLVDLSCRAGLDRTGAILLRSE